MMTDHGEGDLRPNLSRCQEICLGWLKRTGTCTGCPLEASCSRDHEEDGRRGKTGRNMKISEFFIKRY